ncbi:unnamed protein product, partial [Ectocarpus fasciculatus]
HHCAKCRRPTHVGCQTAGGTQAGCCSLCVGLYSQRSKMTWEFHMIMCVY